MEATAAELTNEVNTFLAALSVWAADALPRLISALVLLVVGWWIASRAESAVNALLARQSHIERTLCGVIASLVRYGILTLFVVAVLGQLGIQTTSIIAALGAIGLAIGLAMQGTLSNIAAGMMLLWLRPFRVGDYIQTDHFAGTVKDLGLFASELQSWDGLYQFVPNAELWNRRIINHSRLPQRLIDIEFGVAYDNDIEMGRAALLKLATDDERTVSDPEPILFVDRMDESTVVLRLRVWTANENYWPLRRHLTEHSKRVLNEAGLTLPFPQRDLWIRDVPKGWPGANAA